MPDVWRHYQYVVGVDPGFGCTGLCVMGPQGIVVARAYKGDHGQSVEERNLWLTRNVVCRAFAVTGVGKNSVLFGIEDNHITGGRSAQTALMQRELIGSITALAWEFGFDVVRVAASAAKKALTGSGRADKGDVREAAKSIDGYPAGLPKYADEAVSDAVAVAMAAMNKGNREVAE